jgi:hypothetical protein
MGCDLLGVAVFLVALMIGFSVAVLVLVGGEK